MKNHISKARIAALAVGLAIVMSSCGIQNTTGSSSSQSAASGKTKNAALDIFNVVASSEWCYVTGVPVDIDAPFEYWTIRTIADYNWRFKWNPKNVRIDDEYGIPSIVKCDTLETINVAAAGGATSAAELSAAFVENSTANQCISVENRKKTLQGYDDQIMAHSRDEDKTFYEQMKTGRWITTVQRPCTEANYTNELSSLSCVSVSYKAFEQAFWDEQYELHKEEAGTPYLDLIIVNKEKVGRLATC